jgi:DNA-binding IscR family transcriptional regulator
MSKKFRYGLRAAVDLDLQEAWRGSCAAPVALNAIVKRQGIPEPFLRQIFLVLVGDEMAPLPCVVNRTVCCSARKCSTHALWVRTAALLEKALRGTSIAQLAYHPPTKKVGEDDGSLLAS